MLPYRSTIKEFNRPFRHWYNLSSQWYFFLVAIYAQENLYGKLSNTKACIYTSTIEEKTYEKNSEHKKKEYADHSGYKFKIQTQCSLENCLIIIIGDSNVFTKSSRV